MKKILLILALLLPVAVSANYATLIYNKTGEKVVVDLNDQYYIKDLFKQGLVLYKNQSLGTNVPVTGITWSLSQPITTVASVIPLTKVTDQTGTVVTQANLPTKVYMVIEPASTTNVELIVCPSSGYSSANKQFTGCTRGLSLQGNSETANPLFQHSHASGATIIMSNLGQFYSNFIDNDSNQTIAGIKTFTSSPVIPTPLTDYQAVNKTYADSLVATSTFWTLSGSDIYRTAGNVGIGTSTPDLPLTVYGSTYVGRLISSGNNNQLSLNTNGVSNAANIGSVNGDFRVGVNSASILSPALTIGTDNKVGIGKTSPTKTLDVVGTMNVTGLANFDTLPTVTTTAPTTAGQVIALNSSAKLPAVDGSQLTNIHRLTTATSSFAVWSGGPVTNLVLENYTIPANTLGASGSIEFEYVIQGSGCGAGGAGSGSVTLSFGTKSITMPTFTFGNASPGNQYGRLIIQNTSTSAQKIGYYIITPGGLLSPTNDTGTENTTSDKAVIMKASVGGCNISSEAGFNLFLANIKYNN